MTDRAEIERLLNQTGRTLEGLPDEYPIETVDKIACMTDWEYSNHILHQSDVIELLVGALRDALDKPMQKPLTYDEVIACEKPVWAESSIAGVLDDWFYPFEEYDTEVELLTYGADEAWIKSKTLYNKTWRCWASRPTDEEKEAAAWES